MESDLTPQNKLTVRESDKTMLCVIEREMIIYVRVRE